MAARRTDWRQLGVEPLPESGKARRFRDLETGEQLSRRSVENRRIILSTPWRSWGEWQSTTSPREQSKRARDYRFWAQRAHENDGSFAELRRPGSAFSNAYADWAHMTAEERRADRDKPRGKLHHLLVEAGMRDPNADYPPGGTPLRKGKR